MAYYTKTEMITKDNCVHLYSGATEKELTEKVNLSMLTMGYKLKQGVPGNGIYEKGNRTTRLLLGAFTKYFKFYISTTAAGDDFRVTVGKQSSGMSGGVIGIQQVKKEMNVLSAHLQMV